MIPCWYSAVRFTATKGWYTVSSSQSGHGDSNKAYSWFRSPGVGQYTSSIVRVFRKTPLEVDELDELEVVSVVELVDELELVVEVVDTEDKLVEVELEVLDDVLVALLVGTDEDITED